MDALEYDFRFPFGKPYFSGAGRVSFWEGIFFLYMPRLGRIFFQKKKNARNGPRNRKRLGKHFGNDEAQLHDPHGVWYGFCEGLL